MIMFTPTTYTNTFSKAISFPDKYGTDLKKDFIEVI